MIEQNDAGFIVVYARPKYQSVLYFLFTTARYSVKLILSGELSIFNEQS